MKIVQHSRDFKWWYNIGEWSDEEAPKKWAELQDLIHKTQIHGFFRMVDESYNKEFVAATNEKL